MSLADPRAGCFVAGVLLAAVFASPAAARPGLGTAQELATASTISSTEIAAVFDRRSYSRNAHAHLHVWARTRRLTLQVFVCGPGRSRFRGDPVTEPHTRSWAGSRFPRSVSIHVGGWPSGLYFVRLTARDGRVGYAPFILRKRVPSAPVAVILPTNTWAAYNFRDMDGDGVGDTWYADPSIHAVNLRRPFLPPGMPPYFHNVLPMIHWLTKHVEIADFYADDDFSRFKGGGWLARHYALIIFAGHEEYVTPTEYELVTDARNHGENLAFMSANNFFYRVTCHRAVLHGRMRWRDLGRPEAALVGVQYVDWWQRIYPNKPYVVKGARVAPWLFSDTGLNNGDKFGRFGIEVDARARSSPPQTRLLAIAKDIFGPGKSAEMTYYRTAHRAKVFAAGALTFPARAGSPIVSNLMSNLLAKLTRR